MTKVDFEALARDAYSYAEDNYAMKGFRYDVIVECMTIEEIAAELEEDGYTDYEAARRWVDGRAGLAHEVELNQAWDGPESVRSSSRYDPAHDPAGDDGYEGPTDAEMDEAGSEADREYDRQRQEWQDVRDGL